MIDADSFWMNKDDSANSQPQTQTTVYRKNPQCKKWNIFQRYFTKRAKNFRQDIEGMHTFHDFWRVRFNDTTRTSPDKNTQVSRYHWSGFLTNSWNVASEKWDKMQHLLDTEDSEDQKTSGWIPSTLDGGSVWLKRILSPVCWFRARVPVRDEPSVVAKLVIKVRQRRVNPQRTQNLATCGRKLPDSIL